MTSSSALPERAYDLLHARFGHQTFRPSQEPIIGAVLQGQHVLIVMPTGSGKSLCYQLPALLQDGVTLVISPLIALMKDQVDALQAQGIAATFINSSLTAQEQYERLDACRSGRYQLLYVAPERFRSPRFVETMATTRVSLFAVDEAHCISQWGHDFRPDYLRLREAIAQLGQPQVLALTATATVDVQDDIVRQLGCADMQRFVTGFDRPNLTYRVLTLSQQEKLTAMGAILDAQESGSAIIYASTRRTVEDIAHCLHERGTEALIYHAGLRDGDRQRAQDAFMQGQCRIIVATNAFGMGVDKPDVRCVLHFNMPRSMEAYYQEAGRAGRDGGPAECLLLFSQRDVRIQEFLIEQSYPPRDLIQEVYGSLVTASRAYDEVPLRALLPYCRRGTHEMQVLTCAKILEKAGYLERVSIYETSEDLSTGTPNTLVRLTGEAVAPRQLTLDETALQRRLQHEQQKLRRMVAYARAHECRRQKMLSYFGERWARRQCAACDHCLADGAFAPHRPLPKRAPSEAEWTTLQKILSCVARMRGAYGRAKVIQVLQGSQASDIVNSHLSTLTTYGLLHGTSRAVLHAYLDALLDAACLHVLGDEYPKLDLTPLGQAVMRRQQQVTLALPVAAPPRLPSLTPAVVGVSPSASPPPSYDERLFERLQAERLTLAQAQAVPPYCIFNNRTLREMATARPSTPEGLLQVHGVGPVKAGKYGETFLALIRAHLAEAHPGAPHGDTPIHR